jgi:hypothetical protein
MLGGDGGAEGREDKRVAQLQALGRPGEAEPVAAAEIADQQGFDLAARRPSAEKACRDHPGVVEDQQVAFLQE